MTQSLLIVGAGPSIGREAARRFGRGGWTVVLASRSTERVLQLVARLQSEGVEGNAVAIDATDPVAAAAGIVEADRVTPGLTAVLYNAAIVRRQTFCR